MTFRRTFLHAIADALLAGPWRELPMRARVRRVIGGAKPWLVPLVRRVVRKHREAPGGARSLIPTLEAFAPLDRALARRDLIRIATWIVSRTRMRTPRSFADSIPRLDDVGALARWLALDAEQLVHLAERDGTEYRPSLPAHRHYTYRWIAKPSGGARLLEAPRPLLRRVQRAVLHGILDRIAPHSSAHGFVRGRSVHTHAQSHVARAAVMRIDLHDFFASIRYSRVHAILAALGYPEPVARMLASLCTHRTPRDVLRSAPAPRDVREIQSRHALRQHLRDAHLPQGAPTSPALANLAAYRLDVRLAALARAADAHYTRYADDLTFSGDDAFARSMIRFHAAVSRIAAEEGFRVNARKTRRMRRGGRQLVAGLVVNAQASVPRDECERLEATLCNCARHGPSTQNRDAHPDFRAHLRGRIAWVESVQPARAKKLLVWFDRIDWAK